MNLYTLMRQGKEPRPTTGQHPGMPPDFVPPPSPTKMEDVCEAAILAPVRMDGTVLTISEQACGGTVDGNNISGMTILATRDNESCVYARDGALLNIKNSTLNKTDGAAVPVSSDSPGPMLRGLNSLVLANGEGTKIFVKDCKIISEHEFINDESLKSSHGAFSVFKGETYLKDVLIRLNGSFAHGVYDTLLGKIYLDGCEVETSGECASALATDNPGGDIFATDCVVHTHGPASAGIYCDGGSCVDFTRGHLEADIDAGAIVCNDGKVRITDATVKGAYAARMWQPVTQPAKMEFVHCNLIATEHSAFVFDGGNGTAIFDDCTISAKDDKCLIISRRCYNNYDAIGNGHVILRNSNLTGSLGAADDCSMNVVMENSTVHGQVYRADMKIAYDSKFVFTGDCIAGKLMPETLSCLESTGSYTIQYNPKGSTISGMITIKGGATLVPIADLKN